MADRPNIVFLFPDQLRRDFLSCYGADFIDTPNIDSIAANGTRYDEAYSQSPICVPARNALLSGMNAIRNGITDNNHGIRLDYQAAGIQT
jgi:arylsulfatase A-like enzyme